MLLLRIHEDNVIWLSLMVSLFIHLFVLIISSGHMPNFVHQAQYSVQPSAAMVEVSIEEIDYSRDIGQKGTKAVKKVSEKINKDSLELHSSSAVKIKANPDYFQNPAPEYPELAKQMRQEGLVLLTVEVNAQGLPLRIEITQSCGYHMLDQAALKAVRHWKFQPGSIGGIPVDSTVTVPIRFRLEK